jgi:hypothetical protein
MRSLAVLIVAVALLVPAAPAAAQSDTATATIVVSARFQSRTSLRVSTELLQFDVRAPSEPAVVAVDFSAGARTHEGAEVLLSIESLRAPEGPGGAADVESAVTFAGDVAGMVGGTLSTTPAVAGRWAGSGRRTGRLFFTLRAAVSGAYRIPVRFVLSAP